VSLTNPVRADAMKPLPAIEADIARASTLDPSFYVDDGWFAAARERVFATSWQWLGHEQELPAPESLAPRPLLPGLLDEPLLLARDGAGALRCLSNVCTHRGNLLVGGDCRAAQIRCGYHSRRFDLAGRMTFMPGFAGVHGFPSRADDLPSLPLEGWQGHLFSSLAPSVRFADWIGPVAGAVASLPVQSFEADRERSRDYTVAAHWALYVENYLEGFHIPFVHPGLDQVVDGAGYRTVPLAHGVLQIGRARRPEEAFAANALMLPAPTAGEDPGHAPGRAAPAVAALYAWLFPNLMLNFYPWGLSLNLVLPQAPDRTLVRFRSFVGDRSRLDQGAGGALDRVEREDEAIVEAVQRGVRARLYRGGRYSPERETGVHHFHRLLQAALAAPLS
jgi:choline monooxygenase